VSLTQSLQEENLESLGPWTGQGTGVNIWTKMNLLKVAKRRAKVNPVSTIYSSKDMQESVVQVYILFVHKHKRLDSHNVRKF